MIRFNKQISSYSAVIKELACYFFQLKGKRLFFKTRQTFVARSSVSVVITASLMCRVINGERAQGY